MSPLRSLIDWMSILPSASLLFFWDQRLTRRVICSVEANDDRPLVTYLMVNQYEDCSANRPVGLMIIVLPPPLLETWATNSPPKSPIRELASPALDKLLQFLLKNPDDIY